MILHNLACKGGAISLIREQVNSLIREFHHAKLPYKQVTNNIVFKHVFYHKSFKFDIFQRYILDTFLLIRELKSVTPLQASKHFPCKQGYVVSNNQYLDVSISQCDVQLHVIVIQYINNQKIGYSQKYVIIEAPSFRCAYIYHLKLIQLLIRLNILLYTYKCKIVSNERYACKGENCYHS
ncbi:Hypothetical_protein [Hexamita inflata]|uniref:Hypothetical_protein n=1 Tax=Hexamita inflata TaxID=28002 RepID=A0ABP1HNH2_9EUKA